MVDPRGYYKKFNITYADGTPIPDDAVTFVLRIDEDPYARHAALAYAEAVGNENPALARDLRSLVERYS